ncbi:MAG: hypothetical protein AAF290_12090 [Pseudomonadota bacterium]
MTTRSTARFILFVDLFCIAGVAVFFWLLVAGNPTACCRASNATPMVVALVAYLIVSRRQLDARFWLALIGFSLPAVGLSAYLHLSFLFDWQGIASNAVTPELLFTYLPIYVMVAGATGSAIGWIVGRFVTNG